MELAREERKSRQGPEWGTQLACRMMAGEVRPERLHQPRKVREVLAGLSNDVHTVDVKAHRFGELKEEELWEVLRRCHEFNGLNLAGWQGLTHGTLRSLSLAVGRSLETVDLSRTAVSDAMLEIFCTRLFQLRGLTLAACPQVTNLGLRAVVRACHSTLMSLDLSHSRRINDEGLGYLGGVIAMGPSCTLLQSLNLAHCPKIRDAGLASVAHGCPRLVHVNLEHCEKITCLGVTALSERCPRLAVLSLQECRGVGDSSLLSLGKHSSRLISLNVARCGRITDEGVAALARGCRSLQALNVAGARELSEMGLCVLAQACPGLHSLNITGCMEVSLQGLRALITGIGEDYVMEGKTFVGFLPRKDIWEKRAENAIKDKEDRAGRSVQRCWRAHRRRRVQMAQRRAQRREEAALSIQLAFIRYKRYREHRRKRQLKRNTASVAILQRVYRGHRVRIQAGEMREAKARLLAKSERAVPIQALFRGYRIRLHDIYVGAAIHAMHEDRRQELRNAAAVRLQAMVRAWLGYKRCLAWAELQGQRNRDKDIAARRMQEAARAYSARVAAFRARMEAHMKADVEARAAIRIQAFWRGCLGKFNSSMVRAEIERLIRLRNRKALRIQATFRGHLGRNIWRSQMRSLSRRHWAATEIQKIFRGSRVLWWRDIRMNKVMLHIFRRQHLEFERMRAWADMRDQKRRDDAGRDSCSEDGGEASAADADWHEVWDDVQQAPTFYNPSLNETSEFRPFAFELGLVGMRCQIYWPVQGASFPGYITRFHRRKGKHRIEYEDGDHEWVKLEHEKDRVMLEVAGTWVEYRSYQDPSIAEAKQRAAQLRIKQKANKVLLDREKRWQKLWDEAGGHTRWLDEKTGEVCVAKEDAELWMIHEDEHGDLVFTHQDTGDVRYEDPRFSDEEAQQVILAKAACMQDIRFAVYFCRDLSERCTQFASLGTKAQNELIDALKSGESFAKLGASVSRARQLFHMRAFDAHEEIQGAVALLQYMNELRDWAQEEHKRLQAEKGQWLTGGAKTKGKEERLAGGRPRQSGPGATPEMLEMASNSPVDQVVAPQVEEYVYDATHTFD